MATSPGQFLKTVRERLQIGLQEVEAASEIIADEERNADLAISTSRLNQIENANSIPTFSKLYSLCCIYGLDLNDILARYGVDANRIYTYHGRFLPEATRPLAATIHGSIERLTFPVKLDPSFRFETTQLINRAVAMWGEIPAAFLAKINPRLHTYGFIGIEDRTIAPLIRPGSFVLIDRERTEIERDDWTDESDRPIYFIELRNGYRCGWLQEDGNRLTLIPHPRSRLPLQTFSLASEVDVLGQVVAVAMRLVPPNSPKSETESISPKRNAPAT